MVAVFMVVVAGMAAFAIDHGFSRQEARQAQGVGDASALAAAAELPVPAPDPDDAERAREVAAEYVATNSFGSTAGLTEVDCSGTVPPDAACFSVQGVDIVVATPYAMPDPSPEPHNLIYVQVCRPSETFFGGVFGATAPTVCRTSVGYRQNAAGGFGMGLVSLNKTACPGILFSGNSDTVLTSDGAVMVNSDCESGAMAANGASWRLEAAYIGVVGGTALAPCDPLTQTTQCTETTPHTGIPHFDDPLAGTPIPNASDHPLRTCPSSGGGPPGPRVMEPGRYVNCGNTPPGTLVLRPGLYYMDGSFTVNSNTQVICANTGTPTSVPHGEGCDGVTFFIAAGSSQFNGTSNLYIPPPSTGPYAGISIFQHPNNTSTLTVNGTSDFSEIGSIYAPAGKVDFSGNGQINVNGIVVSSLVELNGNFDLTINVPDDADEYEPEDIMGLWD
ncbi:MAG: hypothetical protein U5K29_05225 [Acidimicrobiales bacterium]|nr:hypothetical protein [Acidimicrobiales bacterium]